MTVIAQVDIAVFRGDDVTLQFTVVNAAGGIVNITGWTLEFKIWNERGEEILSKTTGSGITIVDGPNGRADVALSAANTSLFAPTPLRYLHALRRTNAGAITVVAHGRWQTLEPSRA